MTTKQLSENIGKLGMCEADGFHIRVKIVDARKVFGRVDYLVKPIDGAGQQWVAESRLILTEPETV